MNRLPTEAYIRGLKWTVTRVDTNHKALEKDAYTKERGYYGCCDKYGDYGPELTIYVRASASPQVAWETLWHECVHAIAFGIKPFDIKREMPVEVIAGEIMSLCRQWGLLKG